MAGQIAVFEGNAPVSRDDEKKNEKENEHEKATLALLPLLTYQQVGNPLENADGAVRQEFFKSLSSAAKSPSSAARERPRKIIPHSVMLAAEMERAKVFRLNAELAAQQRAQAAARLQEDGVKKGAHAESQAPAIQKQTPEGPAPAISGSLPFAQHHLSLVLEDYARGDLQRESSVLSEFEFRIMAQGYRADDLMAVLLLTIEDQIWGGEEGAVGGSRKFGNRASAASVPLALRQTAKESSYARLASVREMLRYYFDRNPKDYAGALAIALSLSPDQGNDPALLQERLSYVLAKIGGFALSQKLLAAIKLQKKMDTKKCLIELGYRYDIRQKRLVLGRRTCGTPSEARGILNLLLSSVRK
ncbi:MAG: hypothetical protein WC588_00360 [Candidatus Micrarchaeia archaeon]